MTLLSLWPAIFVFVFAVHSPSTVFAASEDLAPAAKKEGELVLYLSTNLTDANGMIQLFKQKYPFINVNAFRADNEKLLNRILTEAATMKKRGAPIEWVRTAQPIVTGLKPIGLSAKAQHPNAGKLFIDLALSKEGQELIKSFNRIPDRGDVTSELKEGTKLFPADPRWGDTYAKHVEEFREIFFK